MPQPRSRHIHTVYMHTHTQTYIYIYIYTHTHKHTHTHNNRRYKRKSPGIYQPIFEPPGAFAAWRAALPPPFWRAQISEENLVDAYVFCVHACLTTFWGATPLFSGAAIFTMKIQCVRACVRARHTARFVHFVQSQKRGATGLPCVCASFASNARPTRGSITGACARAPPRSHIHAIVCAITCMHIYMSAQSHRCFTTLLKFQQDKPRCSTLDSV